MKTNRKKVYAATGAALVLLAMPLVIPKMAYNGKFLPSSKLVSEDNFVIDMGSKTKEEVKTEYMSHYLANYSDTHDVTLLSLGDEEVKIDFTGVIRYPDAEINSLMDKQQDKGFYSLIATTPEVKVSKLSLDENLIRDRLSEQYFMDEKNFIQPEDAYIIYDEELGKYRIVDEIDGNIPYVDGIVKKISSSDFNTQIDIRDCFSEADVKNTDAKLNNDLTELNKDLQAEITYDILGNTEVLDSKTYFNWISYGDEGELVFDRDKIVEYVDGLREKYNTAYTTRKFKNSYGEIIDISGPYGYAIGEQAETDKIIEDITAGNIVSREPEWYLKGETDGETDWGGTYVEVSIANQHVFMYKDGELILETDCVTGTPNKERATHPGIYPITYMTKNATLKGPGYASFVNYWMPFDGGIGLHDATWRGSFGGKIYKTNGSHGCVNLPLSKAKEIYANAHQGMAVIVY